MASLKPYTYEFQQKLRELFVGLEDHAIKKFDELRDRINDRANIIENGTADNIVTIDSDGNIKDSEHDIPAGDVIGTIDTQTMTNKTITLAGATDTLGSTSLSDTAAMTATTVTSADADGTYGNEERDLINELKQDFNLLFADVTAIRSKLNSLIAELRKTDGCGVLND